jgi:hypothetical protein
MIALKGHWHHDGYVCTHACTMPSINLPFTRMERKEDGKKLIDFPPENVHMLCDKIFFA